jgi:hypothetical protein
MTVKYRTRIKNMFIDLATQIINAHTTCKRGYSTPSEVSNTLSTLELCQLGDKIQ